MTSERIHLMSELYGRRIISLNGRSARLNNKGLYRDLMRGRDNRDSRRVDRNSSRRCNTGLGKECDPIDGDTTIIAWDVGVHIWATSGIANLWLEVLRLRHCEIVLKVACPRAVCEEEVMYGLKFVRGS